MTLSRRDLLGGALALAAFPSMVRAQDVPEHNRASLTEPPPRPPLGLAAARAQTLLDAIVHGDPARADDFFLSRDAFRLIKAVPNPDPLWERLHTAYVNDILALHAATRDLDTAQFAQLRFTGRRGWVVVREEANRLPYWAQRHSFLDYRVGTEERHIEVRTMITWDDQWFITHLSEFHG
jgi:hypothetical protein